MAARSRISLPPLPPGWEECRTEAGEVYYQDHNRGVTQWERPQAQQPVAPQSQGRTPYRPTPAQQVPARPVQTRARSPPLPPGWAKGTTPTGEVYFIDHNTQTSTWEDPRTRPQGATNRVGGTAPAAGMAGRYPPREAVPQQPRSMGAPLSARQLEDQRRKEQELMRQKREIEAEKARIEAQLRMEEDLRRKAAELERRRMEIEREKAEVAQMKAQLSRLEHLPPSGYNAAPVIIPAGRRFEEPPRGYEGHPRAPPPPRYATTRIVPIRPAPATGGRHPAESSPTRRDVRPPPRPKATAVFVPWVCAECNTENKNNKFRCQNCTVNREVPKEEAGDAVAERGPKPCRYGADCRRPDCKFGHPEREGRPAPAPARGGKLCRFGDGCRNPRCAFVHPGRANGEVPSDEILFPETLAPVVVEKAKELYKLGVQVSQKNLELLGQLDEGSALECLQATLSNDSGEDRAELLKVLIDVKLSSPGASLEPAAKRVKLA